MRQGHFDVRDACSPQRLTTPRYRAPGSDHWGGDLLGRCDVKRVAQKIRKTRDETWIATEKVDAPDLVVDETLRVIGSPVPHDSSLTRAAAERCPVNRTDAIWFMGGAQNTNEECYLFQKAARLLGLAYVEHQARL